MPNQYPEHFSSKEKMLSSIVIVIWHLFDILAKEKTFLNWSLVTFHDEVMKILRNLCLHFARQDGHDEKKMERKSLNYCDLNTKR